MPTETMNWGEVLVSENPALGANEPRTHAVAVTTSGHLSAKPRREEEWVSAVNRYGQDDNITKVRRNREQALDIAIRSFRDQRFDTTELMTRAKTILSFLIGDDE